MKVLHINTSDRGGAAKACLRLHEGLLQQGVTSEVLVLHQYDQNKKGVHSFLNRPFPLWQKIRLSLQYRIDRYQKQSLLKGKSRDYEVFSFPESIYDLTSHPAYRQADLIHLHWVAGFLDYRSFFKKNKKPLVWTLHDMSPFNGGFHYRNDYLNHQKNFARLDSLIRKEKLKAFEFLKNPVIVNLSEWLHQYSGQSKAFKNYRQELIPNGIDTEVFKPLDKMTARHVLGLPSEKKLILFVADALNNNRKGYAYLLEALQKLKNNEILFVAVGNGLIPEESLKVHHLGFISNERILALAYSAADVCVVPSLEDNLPNTVLEAMACAVPVVAFDVGGIPELILNYHTGLLAVALDSQDLADKIALLLEHPEMRAGLGKNARNLVEKSYKISIQSGKYLEIYRQLLPETQRAEETFNNVLTNTLLK